MRIFDLDKPEEWTSLFHSFITPKFDRLVKSFEGIDERHEEYQDPFLRSQDVKYLGMGFVETVENEILELIKDQHVLAFHATRLVNTGTVRQQGLNALDCISHLKKVLDVYEQSDDLISKEISSKIKEFLMDGNLEGDISYRVGLCSFTTRRSNLSDGNLDSMFEIFGGEIVAEITDNRLGRKYENFYHPGRPCVVVAAIPFSWGLMGFSAKAAKFILHHVMESMNYKPPQSIPSLPDLMVKRSVPGELIKLVTRPEDLRVRNLE